MEDGRSGLHMVHIVTVAAGTRGTEPATTPQQCLEVRSVHQTQRQRSPLTCVLETSVVQTPLITLDVSANKEVWI